MSQFMIPTDDEFVEQIAMSIARERMYREASDVLEDVVGVRIEDVSIMDQSFDAVFHKIWNGTSELDYNQRDSYRADARAAISAINLKMLTGA